MFWDSFFCCCKSNRVIFKANSLTRSSVFIEFLPHLRTFVFVPLYLEMKSTIAGYEPSIFAPWFEWPAYHVVNGHCVACHLSSGYWSENPVLAAIALGCKSVQADVWHFNNDLNLLVGRSKYSLTQNRTLAKTYVEQIVQILDASNLTASSWQYQTNGMALGTPAIPQKESLILVIDFKTDGEDLWPLVSKSLDPLRQRDCVTYFNGTDVVQRPVTIVVTGKAPYHKVVESAHYRDMFFDAPLERMAALVHSELRGNCSKVAFDSIYAGKTKMMGSHQPSIPQNPAVFSQANAYFASASGPISFSWHLPYLSTSTRLKIRHQVSGAHTRGLKVRLSIAGFWPTLFNKHLWQILAEEGVDYFSINDRQGAIQWAQMSTGKDQA